MRVLGLICARGGSKGIPRKNIKLLMGKPLIAYAIEVGLKAKGIERLVVSTDDQEIAEIAREYGADVPFIRPAELAQDNSLQIDAIKHALEYIQYEDGVYDALCLLQPTCPLRTVEDVDGALAVLEKERADTVISVTKVTGYHPVTMYAELADHSVVPLMRSDSAGVLRQDFSDVFWRNGAVYVVKADVLLKKNSLYGSKVCKYEMPAERSANLDEPFDWLIAEACIRAGAVST